MCGIVGILSNKKILPELIGGLKTLEYRGYDSAGVALFDAQNDSFVVKRSVGKVAALEEKLKDFDSTHFVQGIAHTRWATHGVPSEQNAHPHVAGRVALVHNGILENYVSQKKILMEQGAKFQSQTDTEVFASLINSEIEKRIQSDSFDWNELKLEDKKKIIYLATQAVVLAAQGHFAIVFMVQGIEGEIFAVQRGAPVVVAQADSKIIIASDLQALLPHSKSVYFPENETFISCSKKGIQFFNIHDFTELSLAPEVISWSEEKVAKDGYETYMLKEIFQQPGVIADTLSGRMPTDENSSFIWDDPAAHKALWKNVDRLYLVACGTAYYAAMVAKYYFEKWARIPVEVDIASEFRYREPILGPGTAFGVISQSGETADTLAALRLANQQGVSTFCVCNVPGSTITRESEFHYRTKAGPEIGVASTKAFTTQLTVLCAMALDVARLRGQKEKNYSEELAALARLPHDLELLLKNADQIKKIGATLKNYRTILFIGRGLLFPIALEGALKTKEITYCHAEGYAAGELKHGPIALVDENLLSVVLAPPGPLQQKTLSNLEEIKSRKGRIILIGSEADDSLKSLGEDLIQLPSSAWCTSPMLYVTVLQLLAYGFAKELGTDIDKPRNLAKSVTVE